jgi:hypothetical protein
LLDQGRGEGGRYLLVVRGLGVGPDPGGLALALGLLACCVALALGLGRHDLGLALGLDKLVALLLGLLFLDLLGFDGLLVRLVEADVGQRGLLDLDTVLREPVVSSRWMSALILGRWWRISVATCKAVFAFRTSWAAGSMMTLAKFGPIRWYTSAALSGRRR